ncbi:peptidylprolyl isomerase [Pseudohongiella sp.]|uniref:PpiC domain-containing protein n=1 Tax=marine sediment metagenome TaxID=412755 RepID=A0A0F9YQ76_9ZZZZ|nr:peptidylprolyl isomerase [Pseudohongiella sp.]HDZ10015.1 molecular chaperone SurA [Pseudohongiella sp.]HEA63911.1 molecular chaperone SurA [Pseudohongiella sp.]
MNKFTRQFLSGCKAVSLCAAATLVLLAGAGAGLAGAAERQVLDRVIALVDEGVILQSEYDERLQEILQRAQEMDLQLPPPAQLREQVMENLIIENLQLQLAERVGIRFDDDTLNRVMTDMANQNNMTFEQYVNALESQGVYLTTRERIRKELAVNEVQRGMVNRRINITDQEIENYLNSGTGREAMAPDYLVDQILIPVLATDSAEIERAKEAFAMDLLARVRDGEDFADVRMQAQQNATQGFAVSGGELGWRKADRLPTLFASIVPDMSTGEVSDPIRSSNGFHLIKLSDVRGDSNRLVNQTEARHVLIAPNEIRTEEQARRLAQEVYERISGGEDFNIVARQLSDDTQSVVAGGDLGWVSDGGMPPEFEEVVRDLEIGELSEPFRTSFGWHVAEVTGRREQDLSREYRRQQATNALRNRKFDVELENWMLEIRDEAYVKIIN